MVKYAADEPKGRQLTETACILEYLVSSLMNLKGLGKKYCTCKWSSAIPTP